jgi:hypothetical protein
VSIGMQSGPRIGIQKGPPFPTFWTISARPVGAGQGCGDGASAGWSVIVVATFETPAVITGFDDVTVVGEAIEGAVRELVGIESGVVSGVINLE